MVFFCYILDDVLSMITLIYKGKRAKAERAYSLDLWRNYCKNIIQLKWKI